MKRKLFTFFLISYLLAFAAPFVASAADTTSTSTWTQAGLCSFVSPYPLTSPNEDLSKDEGFQSWNDTNKQYFSTFSAATCGTPNNITHLLEKGDCSATDPNDKTSKAKVVTEITEPIAPTVSLDSNTKVINVYQGQCCLAYYKDSSGNITCEDVRTIYADKLETCQANGINCQLRQWLIASSGIGLLKLFVKQIYTWGAFAIGSIAVGTIIYEGIKISLSGVSGDISGAKTRILQAISGMVLFFLISLLLYTINPDFFS